MPGLGSRGTTERDRGIQYGARFMLKARKLLRVTSPDGGKDIRRKCKHNLPTVCR
jgi:hypothetical protein